MADRPLSTPLPADLPENWTTGQTIAPAGADVGLSQQHGYNYLMEQVNAAQRAANTINESFDAISGKRTCRFTVGTSTAGWTEADCDYLCDGVDDTKQLLAAMEALQEKGGGEIAVLSGRYNLPNGLYPNELSAGIAFTGNPGSTIFVMDGELQISASTGSPVSVSFSGIEFQGGTIRIEGADPARVENCAFRNCSVIFSRLKAFFTGNFFERTVPENINLANSVIAILGSILVEGNRFVSNSQELDVPIYLLNISGASGTVSGNAFIETAPKGSGVIADEGIIVQGNAFQNTVVQVSMRGAVTGNVFWGGGIQAEGAHYSDKDMRGVTAVSGNQLFNGFIRAFGSVAISGNGISAAVGETAVIVKKKYAGAAEPEMTASITGNYITGGSVGIHLIDDPNDAGSGYVAAYKALVTGNRIYDAETPIQIDSTWNGCLVSDNMLPAGKGVTDNGRDNLVRLNSDDPGSGGGGAAGVSSFKGRAGAVVPQTGDYTAAMVGAIPAGAVTAFQAMTQAEYDALTAKNASTLYLIKE